MRQSNSSEIIKKYFPNLSDEQLNQFNLLEDVYRNWNKKINVISRKDIDQFYTHHVLHSLSIAKFISFTDNTKLLDVGTGGGFPGIPLAIIFPNCSFTLNDSIEKKIKVVNNVKSKLKLINVTTLNSRVENIDKKFDFVISRAVAHLSKFCPWVKNKISNVNKNNIHNGIIYLKGGDLENEIKSISKKYTYSITKISDYYKESFFDSKAILHIFNK